MEPRVDQDGSLSTYHQSLAQEYENILLTDDDRIPGQWNSLGPNTATTGFLAEMGIVTSLLVEDDQNIYAGTGATGLFVTHDGGANWASLTDKYLITGIESIIKVHPDTMYIATGFDTWGKVYSKGVLKSQDNGHTWRNTGLSSNYLGISPFSVKGMVMDPDNTQLLCALVQEEYRKSIRIAKTIDGGEHWNNKFIEVTPQGESGRDLRKIEYDPFNSNRIMASGRFLIVSDNDGENWTEITDSIPYNDGQTNYTIERITTAFHPTRNGRILLMLKKYIGEYTNSVVEFYLSDDGGNHFDKIPYAEMTDPPTSGAYSEDKFELEWSKAHYDEFYYAGMGIGKSRIYENGQIKELYNMDIPSGYHKDIRFFQTMSVQGYGSNGESRYLDVIYHGNDGGITKGIESSESGIQWYDMTGNGLNITQYYGLAITEDDKNFYLGGTQDGNLFLHDSYQWYNRANVGDAGEAVIDYDDPRNIYMVSFGTEYYLNKSLDHGNTWLPSVTILPFNARRNDAPLEISSLNPGTLFIGGKQIFKSIDYSLTFNQISHFSDSKDFFKSIRVGPNNDDYIIAGRSNPYWSTPDPLEKLNRLLLTVDGFVTYEDLTPSHGSDFSLHNVGIFDIAIQPDHPSNFYLALDRFEADKKVFKGIRTGYGQVAWTNMSTGLPNLPVNCIEIYKGSEDDEMFAGTDCGVYYFNKNIGHWTKYGNGMPVCPVSDIEINYKTKQLIVSTFGRGMYVAELCEIAPPDLDIYIDTIQVWEGYKRIPASIIILPGGNLTVKGEILLKFNKQIIVHKSAILNIDGGTVTSECPSQTWGGIRILGTATEGQNLVHQGVVFLKNDAKIINADIGVHCFNAEEEGIVYTGGGILMANNTTFRNNRTAVAFERYTYESSISFFKNCKFETNDAPISENYKRFILINEVKGGLFFGSCTFRNEILLPPIASTITETGIESFNSQFIVDRQCPSIPCPNTDEYKSKFENLIFGIHATASIGTRSFKVNNSIFTNNDRGIYAENIINADIRFNKFNIGIDGEKNVGLYLNFCTGYVVEQDTFKFPTNDNYQIGTKGIVINNSGDQDNHIYKNYFEHLEFGILAQDMNRNKDGSRGLRIKCNDFQEAKSDLAITKSVPVNGYGIAYAQGSAEDSTKPGGNLFSNLENDLTYFSIDNDCDEIMYTYHDPSYNRRLEPSRIDNQFTIGKNNSRLPYSPACCPSHTSSGGGSLFEEILPERLHSDSIQSELILLVDDGDTDYDLVMIATALPEENIQIHDELIATSPFVSDTVIQAVISNENVFNNSMVKNIMVANPKSVKSDRVLSDLNSRLNPMPEYLMDEIMEGLDTLSIRELMEIKMQIGLSNYSYGFNRMLSAMLNDSTAQLNDSVIGLLNCDNSFYSKIRKGWVLIENGDSTGAINTLDSIAFTDQLTASQTVELNEQKAFISWYADTEAIDSTQIGVLNYFLSSPSVYVSSYARRLLVKSNFLAYEEPYVLPDNTKKYEIKEKEKKKQVVSRAFLKAYPNPAKDYITIEYDLGNELSVSSIVIYDSHGKQVKSIKLGKQNDQFIVRTGNLKPGDYFIQLISGNQSLSFARFAII